MSFEKHLAERNLNLSDDNSLPHGQRTQKSVKRLIAAVRAMEGEMIEELRDANERCRLSQSQVIQLQEEKRQLESELRKYRVSERLGSIEKLTTADRQALLEVS